MMSACGAGAVACMSGGTLNGYEYFTFAVAGRVVCMVGH
jgi:hypothetical protein